MTLFLTGSPCRKGQGYFTEDNGFAQAVRSRLPKNPAILLVSAAPDDPDYNKWVKESMQECVDNSSIRYRSFTMLDRSLAPRAKELIEGADLVFLCGGHVPTQNRFFLELNLKDLLKDYDGVIIGCSAGSMNCARKVYSHPELPGESIDPDYRLELDGLGLTEINIVPHLEDISGAMLDGRRLMEDIIIPESRQRAFYTFRDGTYILCGNGRETIFGEAYIIENCRMRKICDDGQTYRFMNFIFISPHFPKTYSAFCKNLRNNGVNVLGIADAPYNEISDELRSSLTEYYRVENLEDYNQVYRAVAFFAFKYGKIDWIESNNEYWLEQDARLRTDFNVTTGIKSDRIASIKEKSEMKKYYALGNIPTARQIKAAEGLEKVKEFARMTGYPIIAKPDNGVGADGTFKLCSEADVEEFFATHPGNWQLFVVEEFITGELTSYDAVINSKGEPIFENSCIFPTPIMDVVHGNLDNCYYADKKVPAKLSEIGRRTVKAFGITCRFVHLEFFKLDRDREGLGAKGDYVGLEVNMRPAGGYTPDMMDFAHSTDVYRIWADMVAFDECRTSQGEQFYCAYVGRRDVHSYEHSHEEIVARYGSRLAMCDRMPEALSSALGDTVYMAKFGTKAELKEFFGFVTAAR